MQIRYLLLVSLLASAAHAGPRSSASYTIATDTVALAGRRASSANYTNDGNAGAVTGVSNVAAPAETARHGYAGQLYEVTGFAVSASNTTVNEGATTQLIGLETLDDTTNLALSSASVAWSIVSGPLTSISAAGVASAGTVFQNSPATARGIYLGTPATLALTVANVNLDDFGLYAGDGIDDAWQNQYFGLNNPSAAPGVDADGDGHNNSFEFTAGMVPTDVNSRFVFTIAPVPAQPTQKKVSFSPVIAGRSYTVQFTNTLAPANWQPLTPAGQSDAGNTRTITDGNAPGPQRHYRVLVTKP